MKIPTYAKFLKDVLNKKINLSDPRSPYMKRVQLFKSDRQSEKTQGALLYLALLIMLKLVEVLLI